MCQCSNIDVSGGEFKGSEDEQETTSFFQYYFSFQGLILVVSKSTFSYESYKSMK